MPLVSIVVPVLDDFDAAAALLRQVTSDPRVEIVIADGDYDAGLAALVTGRPDVRLVRTAPGRARQMNAGAAVTSGTWIFFLHADSTLPPDWLNLFAALPADATGGWFQFALDDPAWQARLIEHGVAWRVRRLRLPYGDQGLFVRRDVFARLGGYRELPLMEDVDLVSRLKAGGRLVQMPAPLLTSARRWRRDGWFRRSARNLLLITLYLCGVSPERLARHYPGPRGRRPHVGA